MRIGVLGAGQLGRMLGLAGIPLGLDFRFFDPATEAPASAAGEVIRGSYDDHAALHRFAEGLDILTFEFENVPAASLDLLGEHVTIRPGRLALSVSQDRVTEKQFFRDTGIPAGEWLQVDSLPDIRSAFQQFGPCILKTRRFGYDGKGQFRLQSEDQCETAWQQLGGTPLIAEKFVQFDRELSLVGVRSADGEIRTWPLVENVHRSGILHKTTAPAPHLTPAIQQQADQMLRALLDKLDYVGILTIELFDVGGTLLANEIAPRVHNSGHWTIEGAATSQFENHIRAIAGLPLGSTALRLPSVMLNCIGSMPSPSKVLSVEGAHLHDYSKTPRSGRKVGHITICNEPGNSVDLSSKVAMLEPLVETAREIPTND